MPGWLCRTSHPLLSVFFLFFLLAGAGQAGSGLPDASQPKPTGTPRIAIIIDDMGRTLDGGERVLALPGPVVCAFLPEEPHTRTLAEMAHLQGNEVMLHQPMETMATRLLDKGGMTLAMNETDLRSQLNENLTQVPHVIGVNNHMGSLLTQHPGHMAWLMTAIKEKQNLFFIDSRTTKKTVARQLAYEKGIPSISRDVFLDTYVNEKFIRIQWDRLIALARKQGSAVAIGHPHDETLRVLEEKLATLKQVGIRLVPVSELVEQQYVRDTSWQLSSSH